jgi:hypothetical protein
MHIFRKNRTVCSTNSCVWVKVKVIPQQTEVAQGVPGRLRPQIFLTFGTTRVVGRQPHAPAAFTPGEISGTHFQELSRPQGTWFHRGEPGKKSPVTPLGIDPGTVLCVGTLHTTFLFCEVWGSHSVITKYSSPPEHYAVLNGKTQVPSMD